MKDYKNSHIENDKSNSPFLLAASFNGLVKFTGSHIENGVLYWQFSPKEKAKTLLSQFLTRTERRIPAKDLFDAIETWWRQIEELRNGSYQTR